MSMVRPTEVGDVVEVVTDVDALPVTDGVEAVSELDDVEGVSGVGVPPEHAPSIRAAAAANTAGPNHAGEPPDACRRPDLRRRIPLCSVRHSATRD
jgi:hypothetical protein